MELSLHFRKSADVAVKLLAVTGGTVLALAVSALFITLHVLSGDESSYYRDDTGILWDLMFLTVPPLIYGLLIAPGLWKRTYVSALPRPAPDDDAYEASFRHRSFPPLANPPPPLFSADEVLGMPIARVNLIRGSAGGMLLQASDAASPADHETPSERPTIPGGFACATPAVDDAPDPLVEVTGEEYADERERTDEPDPLA